MTAPVALAVSPTDNSGVTSAIQAVTGPSIELDKDAYTPEETQEGFTFRVTGLEKDQQIDSYVVLESGAEVELRDHWSGGIAGADGSALGWMKIVDNGTGTAFDPGTYTIRTTVIETGEVLEATFTVSEDAPGFETSPANDSVVSLEQEYFTPDETAEGISFRGDGFKHSEDFSVEVVFPDGSVKVVNQIFAAEKDGHIHGTIEEFEDGTSMPLEQSGVYTVRVSQRGGDFTSETTFELYEGDKAPKPGERETGINIEHESYTLAETVDGVAYWAYGFNKDEPYVVELVRPDGSVEEFPADPNEPAVSADGQITGKIQYLVDGKPTQFATPGTYTIRISQNDRAIVGEGQFNVTGDANSGGDPAASVPVENGAVDDNDLASTGATDGNLLWLALGGGLALVAAGAGLMVVRNRNKNADRNETTE